MPWKLLCGGTKYETVKENYFIVEPMNMPYIAYIKNKTTLENQFSVDIYSRTEFKIRKKLS